MSTKSEPTKVAWELAKAILYHHPSYYDPSDDEELLQMSRLIDEKAALPELIEVAKRNSVLGCDLPTWKIPDCKCLPCTARRALQKAGVDHA